MKELSTQQAELVSGGLTGAGQYLGAIFGAALCFGTPFVPYCAATGSFIGGNISNGDIGGGGGMISDFTSASVNDSMYINPTGGVGGFLGDSYEWKPYFGQFVAVDPTLC
ncbi:hypothetical protein [Noviherbaspirillum sp.]|uniref:hypothetical protein n=1 Tax=Noviherbaspirillum sp. TaxID=1926288 RepID=UPI002FE3B4C1